MNRKSTNHFTFSHTREHHHYLGTPFSLSLSLSLSLCISVVAHTCVVFYSKVEHVAFPLTNSNTPSTYTFSSFLSLSSSLSRPSVSARTNLAHLIFSRKQKSIIDSDNTYQKYRYLMLRADCLCILVTYYVKVCLSSEAQFKV